MCCSHQALALIKNHLIKRLMHLSQYCWAEERQDGKEEKSYNCIIEDSISKNV